MHVHVGYTLSINYVYTYISVRIIDENVNLNIIFDQNYLLETCIEINNCFIYD